MLTHLPCCLAKGPLKHGFLDIYLTIFFEPIFPEIHQLWGSPFFGKCLNFHIDFRNTRQNWKKILCFSDNCIWIGCVQFSLLSRECLSLTGNMSTNSLKILCITKRDSFQCNTLTVINKYCKCAGIQIARVCWSICSVASLRVLWNTAI